MDIQNEKQHITDPRRGKSIWGGVILIFVGTFLFLQNMDLDVPHWVFNWPMLLITIGLLIGLKHKFRGGPWFVLTLVGGLFLVKDMGIFNIDLARYGWPLILVIIGVFMLTKRPYSRRREYREWGRHRADQEVIEHEYRWSVGAYKENIQGQHSDDFVNATAIFGSDNRIILSKNFQGGDITSVFGGCEINLSQADFEGTVVIDATAIFGGIELIVPSNWDVKLEVNTILGGVEDKRAVDMLKANPDKRLVIRGTCVFGGMEIKSY